VKTICTLRISLDAMELIIVEIIETKKIAKDLIIITIMNFLKLVSGLDSK
jgi:hypothetical protein